MVADSTARARRSRLPVWLLLLATAQNLYLLGAAALLGWVAYPQLAEVGAAALPAFHAALSRRLGVVFILPELLAFLFVLPLLGVRLVSWPKGAAYGCFVLGLAYFAITFGWHLPVHRLLAAGDASPAVMSKLLVSHGLRTATVALKCGLLLWMLNEVLRSEDAAPLRNP